MTRWPLLLIILALGCSTATAQTGTSQPTAQSSQQTVAGDPCVVNGQTYCVLNPNVVQGNVSQTICKPGWTKTIRPDVAYTNDLKRRQLAQFASLHVGDPQWTMAGVEEDHRLPLEGGGSPTDEHNLSPEVHRQSSLKDQDENAFRHKVCSGEPLRQAQTEFVSKWLAPWPAFKA